MPKTLFPSEEVLAMLAAAPPRIVVLTAGLTAGQLCRAPGQDEWCANEVLAHLRACADMWGGCIAAMLAQDAPTLRALSPRSWIAKTDYLAQEFQPSLEAYTRQRDGLLAVLEPLGPEGWARTATITGAGKALERSVLFYGSWLVEHERPHLKQLENIVGALRVTSR